VFSFLIFNYSFLIGLPQRFKSVFQKRVARVDALNEFFHGLNTALIERVIYHAVVAPTQLPPNMYKPYVIFKNIGQHNANGKLFVGFVLHTALCCYCGLCTTVCPTECLTHSHDYEFSQYTIDAMKYDYLAPDVRAWRDRIVKV
jgi:ferredoxin